MLRIVALILTGLAVFALTLVGVLAATGNLNAESLARLSGAAPQGAAALPPVAASTDSLAEENRKRKAELDAREKALSAREQQLVQREKDLTALRVQVETVKSEIDGAMKSADEERQTQIETVANTISSMKPEAAAERIEKFSVEDQADILKRITKVKDRAKILEAMSPESAARVMTALQSPPI